MAPSLACMLTSCWRSACARVSVCARVCVRTWQWTDLQQVERLVDGGSSVIYTAVYSGMGVIVKVSPDRDNAATNATAMGATWTPQGAVRPPTH